MRDVVGEEVAVGRGHHFVFVAADDEGVCVDVGELFTTIELIASEEVTVDDGWRCSQ